MNQIYEKLPLGFKTKWVKALRNGTWEQCDGTLKKKKSDGGYQYCVLGTAAVLAGAQPAKIRGTMIGKKSQVMKDVPCALKQTASADRLMSMNDQGASFRELADWIEQNL